MGLGDRVSRLYEEGEAKTARAMEKLVGSRGFGALLGEMAENTAAIAKMSADAIDLMLRNARIAGRRDVARLGRQLGRTEDKLERVLQEIEMLRDELGRSPDGAADGDGAAARPRPRARQQRRAAAR